jgi:hypothetical protein
MYILGKQASDFKRECVGQTYCAFLSMLFSTVARQLISRKIQGKTKKKKEDKADTDSASDIEEEIQVQGPSISEGDGKKTDDKVRNCTELCMDCLCVCDIEEEIQMQGPSISEGDGRKTDDKVRNCTEIPTIIDPVALGYF